MDNIAIKLFELREHFNYTQEDIAEYLAVKKQTISGWENKTIKISAKRIKQIADFFHLTTYEFSNKTPQDLIEIATTRGLSKVSKQEKSIKKAINSTSTNTSNPNLNEPNTISTKKNYDIKGSKNVFDLDKSTVNEVQAEYGAESSKLQAENETLRRRVAELEGMVADLKEDKKTLNGQILFLQEELKKK